MSFNIGQFRRDQLDEDLYLNILSTSSYEQNVDVKDSLDIYSSTNSLSGHFLDKAIVLNNGTFDSTKSYYLRVGITLDNRNEVLTLLVKLASSAENNSASVLYLRTYDISPNLLNNADGEIKNAVIEMIFTPNGGYNEIIFLILRTYIDYVTYTLDPDDGSFLYGREIKLEVQCFAEITNIITAKIKQAPLKKLGIQGPPKMLMCIEGEEIRIGPSGIYEIKNGYEINYLGFIIEPSTETDVDATMVTRNNFIVDYYY